MIEYYFETLECELDEIIQVHKELESSSTVIHDYGLITARRIKNLLKEVADSNDLFEERIKHKLVQTADILGVEV